MNREETEVYILEKAKTYKNILCQYPTGYGKSKLAIEVIKSTQQNNAKVLIVIPKLVLIDNWKKEIEKWDANLNVTFTTYISLPKHAGQWDYVIFDECHHLSDRALDALISFNIDRSILLSATVKYTHLRVLKETFRNLFVTRITPREAIQENVLPDPKIVLIPLHLDNRWTNQTIVKNPKCHNTIRIDYTQRWKYKSNKTNRIEISCTQKQYHDDMCELIEWYKRKFFSTNNFAFKNLWLKKAGDRLVWLSNQKNEVIKNILNKIQDKKALIFCNSIEQTEILGEYCINSTNADSMTYLNMFNNNEINHITACNTLNEGVNLAECQVGLYASLNSSEIMVKQRLGRILRHSNPIIIIPYYKNTREEEIVDKMKEDYNPNNIMIIENLDDFKID